MILCDDVNQEELPIIIQHRPVDLTVLNTTLFHQLINLTHVHDLQVPSHILFHHHLL